jgi:hypothetical protein
MNAWSAIVLILSASGSARQPLPARSSTTTHADSLAAIEQVFRYRRRWSRICALGLGLSVQKTVAEEGAEKRHFEPVEARILAPNIRSIFGGLAH